MNQSQFLNVSITLTLHVPDQFQDNLITSFLKTSKSTSSEEDLGVTQMVSISGELNLVHQSIDISSIMMQAAKSIPKSTIV